MSAYDIVTNAASLVGDNQADLNGEVTALDKSLIDAVCAFFEYGTNSDLSSSTRTSTDKDVGVFAEGGGSYTVNISGLSLGTQYYYKAKGRMIRYDDSDSMNYIKDILGFMEDLTDDSTEVDNVVQLLMARTELLRSPYVADTLWTKASSEKFWNVWTIASTGDPAILELKFDFTDVSTIDVRFEYTCYGDLKFNVDGTTLLTVDKDDASGFENRSLDVAGYSGECNFQVTMGNYGDGGVFNIIDDPEGSNAKAQEIYRDGVSSEYLHLVEITFS